MLTKLQNCRTRPWCSNVNEGKIIRKKEIDCSQFRKFKEVNGGILKLN